MGTRMAPTFANLFVADVEEDLLRRASTRFPRPLLWMHYIDDIFLLWPGSPQQLGDFVDFLNTGHPTINFTLQYNMHSIDFLDINIYKGPRFQSSGILDLLPHYKLTNTFSYLHFSSSHPPHVQTGLIKGELTRLLRLSSSPSTYAKHVNLLLTHLRERGYPGKLLRAVARRYPYSLRGSKLRSNTTKATLYQDVIRLICPYHPAFPPPLIRHFHPHSSDKPWQCALTGPTSAALLLLRAKHWPRCWCPPPSVRHAVGIPPVPTQTLFIVFLFIIFICYQTVVSTTDPKHSQFFFLRTFNIFFTINFWSTSLFFPAILQTLLPPYAPVHHSTQSCHATTPHHTYYISHATHKH